VEDATNSQNRGKHPASKSPRKKRKAIIDENLESQSGLTTGRGGMGSKNSKNLARQRTHVVPPAIPVCIDPQHTTRTVMSIRGGTLTKMYEEIGCQASWAEERIMFKREY
jgi:hypothetical protein